MKPESSHWYTKDGEPMHFVPRAKGDGTRPTTLDDARKLNLLPSVTTILGRVVRKPELERWLIQQSVLAVVTAPDLPGEALDAKLTRVLGTEAQQDQESKAAMDRGTEIHDALEAALSGDTVPESIMPWIAPALEHIRGLGTVGATEKVVVGNGYAGRVDLILDHTNGITILDYKTTKRLPDKGAWPEHRMQLGAYAAALDKVACIGNIYISTVDQGAFRVFIWPDWGDDAMAFQQVFRLWCYLTGYDPRPS